MKRYLSILACFVTSIALGVTVNTNTPTVSTVAAMIASGTAATISGTIPVSQLSNFNVTVLSLIANNTPVTISGTIAATQVSGLATVATTGYYSNLLGRPSIPTNNTQLTNGAGYITADGTAATISGTIPVSQVSELTKSAVGLGNVDNTSDASKPISTAAQTALDAKSSTTRVYDIDYLTATPAAGLVGSTGATGTSSNGAWTLTLPSGAKTIDVILVSGGSGAGSGRCGPVGTAASGGGGGAGGAVSIINGLPIAADSSLVINIGNGGAGGAAVATVGNGNSGSTGDPTKITGNTSGILALAWSAPAN